MSRISARVAARHYHQVLTARNEMSRAEALTVLGLGANPSKDEVIRAQRELAKKHHPDTGGDASFMVRINQAVDILLGEPGTSLDDADDESSEDAAIEILDKELTRVGKRAKHWWSPPHNLALNRALFRWNIWYFGLMPFRAHLNAYRPAKNGKPEGIVLRPSWRFHEGHDWDFLTPDMAKKLAAAIKGAEPLKTMATHELDNLEKHFKVTIPSGVRSQILGKVEAIAKRRFDVDELRIKKELWPFDGGKPILLGSFD